MILHIRFLPVLESGINRKADEDQHACRKHILAERFPFRVASILEDLATGGIRACDLYSPADWNFHLASAIRALDDDFHFGIRSRCQLLLPLHCRIVEKPIVA